MNTLKQIKASLRFLKATSGSKPCSYCKALANSRDHVVPYSFLHVNNKKRTYSVDELIVPCCMECNLLASNAVFDNFWDKKSFILEKVQKKYKNLLSSPDWSDKEINELKGNLKQIIFFSQELKKIVRIRIENLKNPECFSNYENNF